jgi:hypothetical protein
LESNTKKEDMIKHIGAIKDMPSKKISPLYKKILCIWKRILPLNGKRHNPRVKKPST